MRLAAALSRSRRQPVRRIRVTAAGGWRWSAQGHENMKETKSGRWHRLSNDVRVVIKPSQIHR
jgi:hypothetical protein